MTRINKRSIKKFLGRHRLLSTSFQSVQKLRRREYYRSVYQQIPIDEKLVLFESFLGKQFACSPRAIYEAMKNDHRFDDYKFVWVFRKADAMRKRIGDERTIVVKYNTRRYFRMYAQAKYWVTNWRLPDCLIKKEGQICVQTWHGTPLKKIGMDLTIEGNATTSQKKGHALYLNDAKKYDYFVSPSRFCTEVFSSAFGLNILDKRDILIESGYPRNDALFNFTDDDVLEIKNQLNIPLEKKVILYAPTWRDNQYTQGVGYSFDLDKEVISFLEHVPDDTIVLMRLHYLVANSVDLTQFGSKIRNVSSYEDINNLYLISDILITDYSSVFFDYADLKRPIVFFMYDLQEYENNIRDFYIELDTLPGPIVETADDLMAVLGNMEEINREYSDKYQEFNSTYNYLDDGGAGLRVAEAVIQLER